MSFFKPFFSQNNENNKNVEELARLKSIYEIAIKTRNFEIQQLVQRNNFFMIFQGVLIACIIYSNNTVPFIHTAICFIGIFLSFFQMQIAAGAKFWQEYWESEVVLAEEKLKEFYRIIKKTEFHQLFNKDINEVKHTIYSRYFKNKPTRLFIKQNYNSEPFFSKGKLRKYNPFTKVDNRILMKPSVSKIPIRTARLLLISWLFLFISSTFIGDWIYNKSMAHRIFTGFPGKSVTSIDIRNNTIPDRNDGYDDDKDK
ncbi:hypothetical protein [Acinetobacter guillouiae]|uniref:RipA family octameric membrane protein n=2 Tax=Acinetobacter TaxID=469 RepID=UPI002FDB0318